MITLPGDRRDADLLATMEATRSFADAYVIYDTVELRGRLPGTIPPLLGSQLPPTVPRVYATGQEEGLRLAWQLLQPGDRLVVIADIVEDAIHHLQTLTASVAEGAACGASMLHERVVNGLQKQCV
jgi:cyanophycin synthetase